MIHSSMIHSSMMSFPVNVEVKLSQESRARKLETPEQKGERETVPLPSCSKFGVSEDDTHSTYLFYKTNIKVNVYINNMFSAQGSQGLLSTNHT